MKSVTIFVMALFAILTLSGCTTISEPFKCSCECNENKFSCNGISIENSGIENLK